MIRKKELVTVFGFQKSIILTILLSLILFSEKAFSQCTIYTVAGGGEMCAGSTGLTITLSGSEVGISYQLKRGTLNVGSTVEGTGSALSWANQSTAGTYTVKAAGSCTLTMNGNAVVTVNALPSQYNLSGGGTICGTQTRTLQLSNSQTGVNYQLQLNGINNGSLAAGTGLSLSWANKSDGGTYSVKATNATTGCFNQMATTTIMTVNTPSSFTISGTGTYCSQGSVGLSGSEVGVTYQLRKNGMAQGSSVSGTGSPLSWNNLTSSGTYTIEATHATSNCSITLSGNAVITIEALPIIFNVSGGGEICGTEVRTVQLNNSQTGFKYQLKHNGIDIGAVVTSATGSSISWANLTSAGTYTVEARNSSSMCPVLMNGTATITVNTPASFTISGAGTYCGQGSVGLSGSETGVTYQLRKNGLAQGSSVSGTGSSLSWSGLTESGAYTIEAKNIAANCLITLPGSASLTIAVAPSIYSVNGGGTICGSEVRGVSCGSQNGFKYQLKNNGVDVGSVITSDGGLISWPNLTSGGTYTVEARNPNSECPVLMSGSAIITVNTPLTFTLGGTGTYCCDQGVVTLSGSETGITYQLKRGPYLVSVEKQGTGSPLSWTNLDESGTYTVMATRNLTTCDITFPTSAVLTINPSPENRYVAGGGEICGTETKKVTIPIPQQNIQYQLRLNAQNYGNPKTTTAGQDMEWEGLTQGGNYSVVAINPATGCSKLMEDSTAIKINTPIKFTVSGGGGLCSGPTITLSDSETGVEYSLVRNGGYSSGTTVGTDSAIVWSLIRDGGLYTVLARRNSTFCRTLMEDSVYVFDPELEIVWGGGTICSPGGSVEVRLQGSEQGGNYQLKKDGSNYGAPVPGTGAVLTWVVSDAGSYTVVANDFNGTCPKPMLQSATVILDLLQSFTVGGGGTVCEGKFINVTLMSQSNVEYQLILNGMPSGGTVTGYNNTIINLMAVKEGDYAVKATHKYGGCNLMMNGTAHVSVIPSPSPFDFTGGAALCDGATGAVSIMDSETGVNYTLKHEGISWPVVQGNGAPITWSALSDGGTYYLEATLLSNGCQRMMIPGQEITFYSYPSSFTLSGGSAICEGMETSSVALNGSQTDVYYQLLVNGESTGTVLSGTGTSLSWPTISAGGTYTVIAKNKFAGCSTPMTGTPAVTLKASPTAFIVGGGGNIDTNPAGYPITLSNSQSGVSYQLQFNGSDLGATLAGNGSILSWAEQTAKGQYTIQATNNTSLCAKPMLGFVVIDSDLYGTPDPVALANYNYIIAEESYQELNATQFANAKIQEKNISYQYFDGLGRPIQTVQVKGSPGRADIVQPITYDAYGRQPNNYLPFVASRAKELFKGSFQTDAISKQAAFYGGLQPFKNKIKTDAAPYATTIFEASPLNRPIENSSPGTIWQPDITARVNSKTIKTDYLTNVDGATNPGEEKIKIWNFASITLNGKPEYIISTSGDYLSGSLYVNVTKDEENRQVRQYTDKFGKVLLKKVQYVNSNANTFADSDWTLTYYIYDDFDRLRFVLQPKFIHRFTDYTAIATDQGKKNMLDSLTFEYRYDERGRMVYKRVPGASHVEMVYDQRDRLVLTQDGNQRLSAKWSFTKYDTLNRPIIAGEYSSSNNWSQMNTAVNSRKKINENTESESAVGYTLNLTYPKVSINDVYTITYYDDYTFLSNLNLGELYDPVIPAGFTEAVFNRVKSLTTGNKIRVLDSSPVQWLISVSYYDDRYRVLQTISDDILGNKNRITHEYFGITSQVTKSLLQHGITLTALSEMEYDHRGRLEKAWQTMDNTPKVLMVYNKYNELGQLVEKNIHSTDGGLTFLQSNDYRYNIRGWLTHLNNSALTNDGSINDDTNDLFGMELKYNTSVVLNGSSTTAQYNGNISSMQWKTNNLKDAPTEKIYGFTYDPLNRLTEAKYATSSSGAWSNDANLFNESLWYDKNGNISKLVRKSLVNGVSVSGGGSAGDIDILKYVYKGNRLDAITDQASSAIKAFGFIENMTLTTGEYEYDANGSMNVDQNKGLVGPNTSNPKGVVYNYLNLPKEVRVGDKKIVYTYDAVGAKHRQIAYDGSGAVVSRTDYVGSIQYEGESPALKFMGTGEGRVVKADTNWDYEYFHKDHLGNTRVVYGYQKQVDGYKATMESALANSEEAEFKNVLQTRVPSPFNHTPASYHTPVPDKVSELNGALAIPGGIPKSIGPAKMLQVSTGDRVQLEVFARYQFGVGTNNTLITTLASAVTNAFGVSSGEAYNALNANVGPVAGNFSRNGTSAKAYLFYILFDINHNYNGQFGYTLVTSDASVGFQRLGLDVTIPAGGYLYTYVANESNVGTSSSVYFDDFSLIHTRNTNALQVVQTNDYYAFGLAFNSYSRENSIENRYLYNQGTGEKTFLTERVYDLGLNVDLSRDRTYDYITGRWWQIDPLADEPDFTSLSPYNYSFNNPIRYNDPYGDCPICPALPLIFGGSAVAEGITFAAVGATLITFKDEIVEAVDKAITQAAENGGVSGYSPAVGFAMSSSKPGELTSTKRSASDQKLIDKSMQQKAKEAKAKARAEGRQQQTQQGKEKEGNSNQETRGSHDSGNKGKAGKGDHENANARRAREQAKADQKKEESKKKN